MFPETAITFFRPKRYTDLRCYL